MKKLLAILLLYSFSMSCAAQENEISFRTMITKELQKTSTRQALISAGLLSVGMCLNYVALPEDYTLSANFAVAFPMLAAGYILKKSYIPPVELQKNIMYAAALTTGIFGFVIEFNACHDCPLFSINYHAPKDSDDFFSYQCTHPTDDADESCKALCGLAMGATIPAFFFSGMMFEASLASRIADGNDMN